jgi:hypothetical protein
MCAFDTSKGSLSSHQPSLLSSLHACHVTSTSTVIVKSIGDSARCRDCAAPCSSPVCTVPMSCRTKTQILLLKHKKIHTLKAFTSPSFEAVPQFLRPQALSSSLQW